MINFLLFLWQLPQNILGILVILFTGARYNDISYDKSENFWWATKRGHFGVSRGYFGVSLGKYIIFGPGQVSRDSLKHEQGHQKQSLYLGPLYLIIIGLPSILGNICDILFHKEWDMQSRYYWYYNQPWEKWADKLGGVAR